MPPSSALPASGCICPLPELGCLPSQYCSRKTLWLPCMPAEVASIGLAGALAAAAASCSCTQVSTSLAHAIFVTHSDKGDLRGVCRMRPGSSSQAVASMIVRRSASQ